MEHNNYLLTQIIEHNSYLLTQIMEHNKSEEICR